jgi:3-deoxy-D-manno-octulosonic-acid transferase/heptosyltransferase-1
MNILIVKMSAVGDVIHTLPALNALRKHYPDAHIAWLVEEASADLVAGHRAVNRVLVSGRKRWIKELLGSGNRAGLREAYRFIGELRDTSYDLILDFQGLLKSSVLIALCRGKRKVGFGKGMEHAEQSYRFLNERVPAVSMEHHALLRGLLLLEALGIPSPEIVYDLPVKDRHRNAVRDLLGGQGVTRDKALVAIHPMAKWDTKLWDNTKFAGLADRLMEEYEARIVFTGSLTDRGVIEDIVSRMKGRASNLAGETSLLTLAALYEEAAFVVSPDTGPMHLAAAVGTPVVALFGPTAPWRTGPFGAGHRIIRAELECSPCFKRQCDTKACMERIFVEDVMDAIRNKGLV